MGEKDFFTVSAADSREFTQDEYRVRLDLRPRVLALEVEPGRVAWPWSHFVSASLLAQKAKQFDNGLYASLEVLPRKPRFLRTPAHDLTHEPPDLALPFVLAARQLGWAPDAIPHGWQSAVDGIVSDFLSDEQRSKPLGFYAWTDPLGAIFRQDRLLHRPLALQDAGALVSRLRRHSALRNDYERLLGLAERLTNPFASPNFRRDQAAYSLAHPMMAEACIHERLPRF